MANTILQGAEKGEKEEGLSISGESPLGSIRRALTGAALGVLAMQVPTGASAEDVRIAGNSTSGKVAGVFDGIPTTEKEMKEAQERQRVISEFLLLRQAGIKYYAPYLEEFNALDEEGQYQVALAIYPDNAIGGSDLSREFIELVRNLRVPENMIDAILEEARKGGADEEWDMPAFEVALFQIREQGDSGTNTIGDLALFSKNTGNTVSKIYIVVASLQAQERQKAVTERQKAVTERQKAVTERQKAVTERQKAVKRTADALERAADALERAADAVDN